MRDGSGPALVLPVAVVDLVVDMCGFVEALADGEWLPGPLRQNALDFLMRWDECMADVGGRVVRGPVVLGEHGGAAPIGTVEALKVAVVCVQQARWLLEDPEPGLSMLVAAVEDRLWLAQSGLELVIWMRA